MKFVKTLKLLGLCLPAACFGAGLVDPRVAMNAEIMAIQAKYAPMIADFLNQGSQKKEYTGTYNGYSVKSTVSQADADTKARAAWQAAQPQISSAITQAVQAVQTAVAATTTARPTGASGPSGDQNPPWYWASAIGSKGTQYGYGSTVAAAQSNAVLVADGKATPAQKPVPVSAATAAASAVVKAISPVPAPVKTYSATVNGFSATSQSSQPDADVQARALWIKTKAPSAQFVSSGNYDAFGWKPFSPSRMATISFTALGTNDVHLALQTTDGGYMEVVIGGWNNTRSALRMFKPDAAAAGRIKQKGGDSYFATKLPSPSAPVHITATVNGSALILNVGGVSSTVPLASVPGLKQGEPTLLDATFKAYSFRAYSEFAWGVSADAAAVMTAQDQSAPVKAS